MLLRERDDPLCRLTELELELRLDVPRREEVARMHELDLVRLGRVCRVELAALDGFRGSVPVIP